GQVRRRFGSPGKGRGQFAEVTALALAGRELAIADVGNRKVEFFRLPEAPAAGAEIERLPGVRRAESMGVDCQRAYAFLPGEVLCLDPRNRRVVRLDAAGQVKV